MQSYDSLIIILIIKVAKIKSKFLFDIMISDLIPPFDYRIKSSQYDPTATANGDKSF